MQARYVALVAAALVAAALLPASSSSATTDPVAIGTGSTALATSLSDPSALTTETVYSTDGSGQYGTSTVALDGTATTATLGSDGYLCGNVQYRATQKWYDFWGIVLWTYRSTFGVHVCHDEVQYVVNLYDEPMDSTLGWTWCGSIVRQQLNTLPYTSARSYTKGCFDVADKILDVRYPWARMTIGGNGGLWARSTGVG